MNAGMGEQMDAGEVGNSDIERHARALLIGSTEALPGAVRSRLTQARHAALRARHARLRYRLQRWLPAGAVAAAALALLVVFIPHGHAPVSPIVSGGGLDDIDLLSSDVPLNADQDVDYQFYEWAVEQADGRGGAAAANAASSSGT